MDAVEPIRTEEEYEATLERIEEIFGAEVGTPEGDELDLLVDLVEAYESRHYPIGPPDPVEAVKFRMDQAGLGLSDLVPFAGSLDEVSEVLSGKRPITASMVRALHERLGIPADVLLRGRDAKL